MPMLVERWRRFVAVFVAAVALVAWAAPAFAVEKYKRRPRIPKRLGVIAFRNYSVDATGIFREGSDALPDDALLTAAMRYVERRMGLDDDIELVDERALREELTSTERYRDGIVLAREWFNLGVDHFRALRLQRALENLERAEKLYLDVFQDVVEPYALAELELYRGLTHLEMGASDLAHIAFKWLFFLNPWKHFEPGYHAPATEDALRSALVDLRLTLDRDHPLMTAERADRLIEELRLDGIIYAHLDRNDQGHSELRLVIYERRPRPAVFTETLPLRGAAGDEEVLDRAITRWRACADWAHPKEPPRRRGRIYLDSGITESFFLIHPTRQLFHNVGFAVGFAYQLSDGFDLFLHSSVATTLADPDRDIYKSATSVRLILGAGYTYHRDWLRVFVHPGIDITYLGDLSWTSNVHCKFFSDFPRDELPPECPPSDYRSLEWPVLVGLNLKIGVDFFLAEGLYTHIQTGFSAYFLPLDQTDTLNFPLHFELGVGYAF